MDKPTRALLKGAVTRCRETLEGSLARVLEGEFGIHCDGLVEPESGVSHLDSDRLAQRSAVVGHLRHFQAQGASPPEAVAAVIREAAFTHLNRLCAYKMLEHRKLIRESVGRGIDSTGFKFYLADRPEEQLLWASGRQDIPYLRFLTWLARSHSDQISVLFSPDDVANYLVPQYMDVVEVLEIINGEDLESVWDDDEAVGWIYQYFTPDEMRTRVRKESSAPRNSHELAFLNQFYTPRYVVEFLVDNTLGRLWYDMQRGNTTLSDSCRYMVYTPGEYKDIPKRDPREIRIMDPACGSGHFLLYSFDVMLRIYEEAYADPEIGPRLAASYPTEESLRSALPGLILEHNLYGIDIDLRATQITAIALWLRAQRAFTEAGIPGNGRPAINKANIICAEPMPGEADMLEEFLMSLESPPLRPLVREVFERMKLAGEAGSLLKIEDEIRGVVEDAKERWQGLSRGHQLTLISDELRVQYENQTELDLFALTTDQFWAEAESNIVKSLRRYAERNGRASDPFVRKLFAGDAGRGFAFVDACRKQYDVVLMNPPFGEPSVGSRMYIRQNYLISGQNIACAFVERWFGKCTPYGRFGAITTRTPLFQSSNAAWRKEVLVKDGRLRVFADLGFGVLDAMIETAAYVLARPSFGSPALFLRVLREEDKAAAVSEAIVNSANPSRFSVNTASFEQVPNSPLCYWVSDTVRRMYSKLPSFKGENRVVKQGLATADDFRFVRLWTEVPPHKIGSKWFPFAKGGAYSPYYADLHLVVNWENSGEEIKANRHPDGRVRSNVWMLKETEKQWFFQPGLTWQGRPSRRGGFSIVPSGCIFSHTGMMAFMPSKDLWWSVAVANSTPFIGLLHLLMPRGGADSGQTLRYEVGYVGSVPMILPTSDTVKELEMASFDGFRSQRELASIQETCLWFRLPSTTYSKFNRSIWALWQTCNSEIGSLTESLREVRLAVDDVVSELYGLDDDDIACLKESAGDIPLSARSTSLDVVTTEEECGRMDEQLDGGEVAIAASSFTAGIFSWCLGVAFGRWDVRFATGERPIPTLPDDPFTPLPAYSPGMLVDPLVIAGKLEYPIRVDSDGILVDDPENSDDIVRAVREALEAVWQDRAEDIELEACELLGVSDLREYFRDPRRFFDYHIKQYSRSKRKAPIYWLLQSPKRFYGVWLYYHRLNRDTLFKVLAMYVEPKIRLEQTRLDQMRAERERAGTGGSDVKRLERAIDRHEALMSDLHAFRDRLVRAAEHYLEPDLDDGVILNMAPLWEVVPWKEPAKYWQELKQGKYSWSTVARQLAARR